MVALIAPGMGIAAIRTSALNIAVGKEPFLGRGVVLLAFLAQKVAVFGEVEEHLLGDLAVVAGGCFRVKIEGNAVKAEEFLVLWVVKGHDFGRRNLAAVGLDGDWGPVAVRAGNHQDLVTAEAVIAGANIGRDEVATHVADVEVAVDIRPGHADEDTLSHELL